MTETSMVEWRDLVNALLYDMQFVRVLDDQAVEECARHLVGRTELDLTPAQEHALLVEALRSDERLTELVDRHPEAVVRDFLGRVVARMEEMRPWPTPPYQALPPERWADFAGARPIGRIGTWYVDVQARLRKVFWGLPDDERGTSVLILQLRMGEQVALVGPWWPDSDDVAVVARDGDRAVETLAAFLDATGFTADEVIPVTVSE
ncbi:hypothetical protein [Thermomonospora amylolytica]|uniref:hypothetical protein n=1 Tax=Thermomonospora amylolytica TaxID=1411117 RepID=UPI000E6B8AAA|nr:hypothetical protein [Thermomonospora amylolytica]